ncbi:MAG: hypothetical protein ACE5PT_13865 [Gemmatimonadales bacterium]
MTDPDLKDALQSIREKLEKGLPGVDPNKRLHGRPVTFRVVSGQAAEIVYRDVPSIDEAEVMGVKRLIGASSFCTVRPQTAETLTVTFVVPLKREKETD